jgi:hypothetical protein
VNLNLLDIAGGKVTQGRTCNGNDQEGTDTGSYDGLLVLAKESRCRWCSRCWIALVRDLLALKFCPSIPTAVRTARAIVDALKDDGRGQVLVTISEFCMIPKAITYIVRGTQINRFG